MSIEKEEVQELINANNDKLLDPFKGLLEQTVSQIKRSNQESAEGQMKEIKRLKFKFNQKLSETLDIAKSSRRTIPAREGKERFRGR